MNSHKIYFYISNTFLVLFFIIGLLLILAAFPTRNGYRLLCVMSGSMVPKMPVGSLVLVKPQASYKIGDIVSYQLASTTTGQSVNDIITHRIVKKSVQNGINVYLTKGDANNGNDLYPITNANIIGREFFDIPWLGYLLVYARNGLGLILIIVIPSTIIIYDEFLKLKKESLAILEKKRAKKKLSEVSDESL
jgi:signal peptidase